MDTIWDVPVARPTIDAVYKVFNSIHNWPGSVILAWKNTWYIPGWRLNCDALIRVISIPNAGPSFEKFIADPGATVADGVIK